MNFIILMIAVFYCLVQFVYFHLRTDPEHDAQILSIGVVFILISLAFK